MLNSVDWNSLRKYGIDLSLVGCAILLLSALFFLSVPAFDILLTVSIGFVFLIAGCYVYIKAKEYLRKKP